MNTTARLIESVGRQFAARTAKQVITVTVVLFGMSCGRSEGAERAVYLSHPIAGTTIRHNQQWGDFGRNTAAAATGRPGSPMRIGEKVYSKGLGHHANGEIAVDLGGQYSAFCTTIGVQWQGGNKGSVVFRVLVDGKTAFESKPMSDSDPAEHVRVPLNNARQLRLVATDAGNGIGCDMANWAEARVVRREGIPFFGEASFSFNGHDAPPPSSEVTGLAIVAQETGPQVALIQSEQTFVAGVRANEIVQLKIPITEYEHPLTFTAEVSITHGRQAEVGIALNDMKTVRKISRGDCVELETLTSTDLHQTTLVITTRGVNGETAVQWRRLQYRLGDKTFDIPLVWAKGNEVFPPPRLPNPRPSIEDLLIQWDWRMQDGIGTVREPRAWADTIEEIVRRGDGLINTLTDASVPLGDLARQWAALKETRTQLAESTDTRNSQWEDLWRNFHLIRRQIVLRGPLSNIGPLLFAKRVPACFSHQLTQYYGMCARPGGGVFVLDNPGVSMRCRELTKLPPGSYQHPEVSWDGRRIMFAFCEAKSAPTDRRSHQHRHYHLYEISSDGTDLRQLTDGPYDDFSPRYLPNGEILFISTRRGGFHRCGAGPCPVYTLAVACADGSNARTISYHETHEWDPAVLNDGRIIYTRWDYVDRHAVHYQQLWACRPDGTNVTAYYGNNTLNPVGVWEARPVPDSNLVMATAGAHHAMTAGSIILLNVGKGIDGLDPITRLTPDVLFPESEFRVQRWHAPAGVSSQPPSPVAALRWPGHCYRTPYPLSRDFFLAAYSYDPLIGEPNSNKSNMFGIYFVDRFGNKELIYRDFNLSSLWPMPLRSRTRPPALPTNLAHTESDEGTFFVQNVYESWPELPTNGPGGIKNLRVLQVLLKTTPHANTPKVGLANASPGKQVLGTVPVEPDGSAYFRAPARVPLAFQALDEDGMAVQTMRSLTYLQPGEQISCVGCHEHRRSAPSALPRALARNRPPSTITPSPDGSKPLSFQILVQPVLDEKCVSCHQGSEAAGGIALTGDRAGSFTDSYNALAPLVPFSEWKSTPAANSEPMTHPGRFGARASRLTTLLRNGHEGVTLTDQQWERLITWMDANALFYGTFNPKDQQRQLRGERIAAPALE